MAGAGAYAAMPHAAGLFAFIGRGAVEMYRAARAGNPWPRTWEAQTEYGV